MQGKFLGAGIISGSDGNRYTCNESDFKNLNSKDFNSLSGVEVDFEISSDENGNKTAKDIFIIKSAGVSLDSLGSIANNDVGGIKIKAIIALALSALSFVNYIGWACAIIGLVLMIIAIFGANKLANSHTLFKNYIIGAVITFIGFIVVAMAAATAATAAAMSMLSGSSAGFSASLLIYIVIALIIILPGLWFTYKFYKELSALTGVELFMIAFYLYAAGIILSAFVVFGIITTIVSVAGSVVLIFAWLKVEQIKENA